MALVCEDLYDINPHTHDPHMIMHAAALRMRIDQPEFFAVPENATDLLRRAERRTANS